MKFLNIRFEEIQIIFYRYIQFSLHFKIMNRNMKCKYIKIIFSYYNTFLLCFNLYYKMRYLKENYRLNTEL